MSEKDLLKYITEEQLEDLCFWFHKFFRVVDLKNNADVNMWNAIDNLEDDDYLEAMKSSLEEIGIKIKKVNKE